MLNAHPVVQNIRNTVDRDFIPNVRRLLAGWLQIHYKQHHIFESIQVHISWHVTW